MIHNNPMAYSEPPLPVGTSYTITSSGTWTCPATGQWQIELHGGGGGGGGGYLSSRIPPAYGYNGAGGGGSGFLQTISMRVNDIYDIVIGTGGSRGTNGFGTPAVSSTNGGNGGATSIISPTGTEITCNGGIGGRAATSSAPGSGGAASGNIATSGGSPTLIGGGLGNIDKPEQTYGNGGVGGSGNTQPTAGQPGAAILTYLGK